MPYLLPDKETNPHLWGRRRKHLVVAICVFSTFSAAYSAGSYASAVLPLMDKFNASKVGTLAGITTFTIGVSLFPMISSPISEVYGRRHLYVGTYVLFEAATIGCALVGNLAGMLILRFLVGIGASSFSTLVGGILADIHPNDTRGLPMTLFTTGTFIGTAVGPLASNYIVYRMPYPWVFWVQAIFNGVGVICVSLLLPETRMSVLLRRKAVKLNGSQGDTHYEVYDESKQPLLQLIRVSLSRPFYFLATESVVFWFSLWISFAWSILYLFFVSIPYVFEVLQGFSLDKVGLVYLAVIIASFIALIITLVVAKFFERSKRPEARLYSTCGLSILLPAGLFMYSFTANLHFMLPITAVFLITFGIYSIYLAVFNYLSDAYGLYASSALAAQSFCRNVLAGFFPLFGEAMFANLTVPRGGSILAGIAVGLSFVPFVLVFFGEKIRLRSEWLVKSHSVAETVASKETETEA